MAYQRYKIPSTFQASEAQAIVSEEMNEYYSAHLLYCQAAREARQANDFDAHARLSQKAKEMWAEHCHHSLGGYRA
jgi:hypothetical protein